MSHKTQAPEQKFLLAVFGESVGEIHLELPLNAREHLLAFLRSDIGIKQRTMEILIFSYGLETGKKMDIGKISDHFGLTRQNIRKVISKGLRELRHPKRSNVLRMMFPLFGKKIEEVFVKHRPPS